MPNPFEQGSLVWSYLRYSTDDQNIDSQEHAVRAWCAEHKLVLGRVFRDEARSGKSTAGRREFLTMIDLLSGDDLSPRPVGLVLWNYARFARDIDDAQYFKSKLRRSGYILHSMVDLVPAGDEGRIIEAVIDYSNAKERKDRSREARRGLHDRARQGFNTGGFPPVGYRRSAPVELGRKKNGDMRIAYRWEIDPEIEYKVRRAWRMRLEGRNYQEIHRAVRLYKNFGCYFSMFNNLTYAGYRKCGELQVPDAHPTYVTRKQFDRVQAMRRLTRGNGKAPDGNPDDARRRVGRYLLSGVLFCGCGAAMIGDSLTAHGFTHAYYRCGRQQREGRAACSQSKTVAWYVEELVRDWVSDHVLTLDRLTAARDQINRALSGDQDGLKARKVALTKELESLDRRVRRLVDAIESTGLTEEIQARLQERRIEAKRIETEIAGIESALTQQRLEISDDALAYLAEHMREILKNGKPDEVRAVLRASLVRVDLSGEMLRVQYVQPMTGFESMPPKVNWLKTSFLLPVEEGVIPYPRPPTGRASSRYGAH